MINVFGIIILETSSEETPATKGTYFTRQVDLPSTFLSEMARRAMEGGTQNCVLRGEDFKVVCTVVDESTVAGFLLEKNEDSAQVLVNFEGKKKKIISGMNTRTLSSTLKEMVQFEEEVNQKLSDPKLLKDKVIAQTNQLLDEGDFEKAKGLISLAGEIPAKLVDTVTSAEQARAEGNFKLAEKQYRIAADHAAAVEEGHLREVLLAKAERVKQIPSFLKRQKSNIQKLQKPQADQDYDTLISIATHTITLSDNLEDEDIIPDLRILKDVAAEAALLKKELDTKDAKLRIIIEKIEAKRGKAVNINNA